MLFEISNKENGNLAKDLEKVIIVDLQRADYTKSDLLVQKLENHVKK